MVNDERKTPKEKGIKYFHNICREHSFIPEPGLSVLIEQTISLALKEQVKEIEDFVHNLFVGRNGLIQADWKIEILEQLKKLERNLNE